MYSLHDIEKKQSIRFPEKYVKLYQSNFKEINNKFQFHIKEENFKIMKFLTATEINNILEEFYDFFGYDIIPIAEMEHNDYLCLYYAKNRQIPSIIYWNYELALENSEEAILFLYNDITEFESQLS